uniref:Integrase catalytic domain-containing protein n=1 Tax=Hucho hucho TaxID=62062 RepID=A0A4W5JUG1_9TELE
MAQLDHLENTQLKKYTSDEFQSFSKAWDFTHITSSPGYLQSNGKVESAVKTAKRLMAKAKRAGADPYLAMLDHRNTPSQGTDSSPAMVLMGRRTKTLLIMRENLLRPGMANCQLEKFKERQQKQAKYYDSSAKDLTELQRDDRVRVQPLTGQKQWWLRATVVRPMEQRSYEVKTEQGQVFRRNRRHLRKSREIEEDFPTVEEPGTEPINRAPADAHSQQVLSICGNSFGKAFQVKLVERMPSVSKAVIKAKGGYFEESQ